MRLDQNSCLIKTQSIEDFTSLTIAKNNELFEDIERGRLLSIDRVQSMVSRKGNNFRGAKA